MIQHYKRIPENVLEEIHSNDSIVPQILHDAKFPKLSIDKTWDGIYFLLTEKSTSDGVDKSDPKGWIILGHDELGPDMGYGPARLVTPEEVSQIVQLLDSLKNKDVEKNYDSTMMNESEIYPEGIWEEEGLKEWLMENYEHIKDFYKEAAKAGEAILIWTN